MSLQQEFTLTTIVLTDDSVCVSVKEARESCILMSIVNKLCLLHWQYKALLLDICSSVSGAFRLHLLVLRLANKALGSFLLR